MSQEERTNLFGLTRGAFEAFSRAADGKPYRAHQIMKWAYHERQLDFEAVVVNFHVTEEFIVLNFTFG